MPPAEHRPEAAAGPPEPAAAPVPPGTPGRDAAGGGGSEHDATSMPSDPPGRDRDAAGRARNARPRDGLGRPLRRGADGEPPAPDAPALEPGAALDAAQRLLDAGRPFHAHEVLEASWKAAPPAERDLWQGLAQLAVGLTHARRGNAAGAATLLRRGAARIGGYPAGGGPGTHGIDPAALAGAAAGLAGRIDSGGLDSLPPGALDLRLRPADGPPPGSGR